MAAKNTGSLTQNYMSNSKENLHGTTYKKSGSRSKLNPLKERDNVRRNAVKGVPQRKFQLLREPQPQKIEKPLPQACRSNLYDEHWASKQERGFTRWLNHIFSPVTNYHHSAKKALGVLDVCGTKSDKQLQSKDQFSFYDGRFTNRLRQAAFLLYQSQPFSLAIKRLETEIEKRSLMFLADRNPLVDVGMKAELANLLLNSYHPLWLKTALEAVFGKEVNVLTCSSLDEFSLSLRNFLQTYLFHKVALHKKDFTSQFILKKYLLLILFLDKAKLTRLIDYDPCLFQVNSSVKSTKDILKLVSYKYLSAEGDIVKHLVQIGFSITCVQNAIEEFDCTVVNLGADLRDGVRLVRLVELLSGNWKLSRLLRVPATTRMQRIHNVQIALDELKNYLALPAGVVASCIADGHREKTLSLLWSIVFHYKVECVLNESQLKDEISALKKISRPSSTRRSSFEPNVFFESSKLTVLLEWCREVCAIYGVSVHNFSSSFSDGRVLCYLIHHYHPSLLCRERIQNITTSNHFSSHVGGSPESRHQDSAWSKTFSPTCGVDKQRKLQLENERSNFKLVAESLSVLGGVPLLALSKDMSDTLPDEKIVIAYVSYLCSQLLLLRKEITAARCIQSAWRSYLAFKNKNVKMKSSAATIIASAYRGYSCHKQYRRLKTCCVKMQRLVRLKLHCKKNNAARTIQAWFRGIIVRRQYLQLRKSAVTIQRHYREFLRCVRHEKAVLVIQNCYRTYRRRKLCIKMEASALVIQRQYRIYIEGKRQKERTEKCIILQAAVRAWRARRDYARTKLAIMLLQRFYHSCKIRRNFLQIRQYCITIQRWYRSIKAMQMQQTTYRKIQNSALTIQRYYKGFVVRKQYTQYYSSTTFIQNYFRTYLWSKQCRAKYLKLKQSVSCVQARYRANKKRDAQLSVYKSQRQAAIVIQQHYRAFVLQQKTRADYLALKQAVVTIETRYLALKAAQHYFYQYQLKRSSATTIQRWYLAIRCGKSQKKGFVKLKCAAIVIQRKFRANKKRDKECRKFTRLKAASVCIQHYYRGLQQKREYEKLRKATLTLQSHYRAKQLGFRLRCEYVKMIEAATCIQRRFKSYRVMKQFRVDFLQTKAAVLIIQKYFRATQKRNFEFRNYSQLKKAAVLLQQHYRARKLGCAQRNYYVQLKTSATIIERYYLGFKIKQSLLLKKKMVLCLQNRYRTLIATRKQRTRYLTTLKAVSVIQSYYRQWQCRRDFVKLKAAALCLQCHFRSSHLAKKQRKTFQAIRHAVIRFQAHVRGFIVLRKYRATRKAVITVQAHYRAYVVRKNCRQQFLSLKKATVVIQKVYRGFASRKKYLAQKSATITIQRYYRAMCIGSAVRNAYLAEKRAALIIQSCYRGVICRKKYKDMKTASVIIQQWYRSQVMKQFYRSKYLQTKTAALTIERYILASKQRKCYLEMKSAAVLIQSQYRAWKIGTRDRNDYLQVRKATVIIQQSYKSRKHRNRFLELEAAVVLIQKHFRLFQKKKQCQLEHSSAVIIQRNWRQYHLIKQAKELRTKRNHAAIVVQKSMKMFCAFQKYKNLKKSVVVIQSYVRGWLVRTGYRKLKIATIQLQSGFRMFKARNMFLKKRNATCVLQSYLRRNSTRNHFLLLKHSAIVIQKNIRRQLCRAKYLKFLSSVVRLQAASRGRFVRYNIEKKLIAITKLQSYARMYIHRSHWLSLRSSAIVLQKAYRRKKVHARENSAAQCLQKYYRLRLQRRNQLKLAKQHAAARVIQSWYRIRRASRALKAYYTALTSSVLAIQKIYRGVLARRRVQRIKKAIVTIQSFYRGWKVRKNQTNPAIRDACVRVIRMSIEGSKSPTIRQKLPILLEQLLHSRFLSTAADILTSLELMSDVSERCAKDISSSAAVQVLLKLIQESNRSTASLMLVLTVLNILWNLSRWSSISLEVFQNDKLKCVLIDLMLKTYSTYPLVMNRCCDILLFSTSHEFIHFLPGDIKRLNSLLAMLEKKRKNLMKTPASQKSLKPGDLSLCCDKLKLLSSKTS